MHVGGEGAPESEMIGAGLLLADAPLPGAALLHPERRFWPPGSIPILFHFVLAAYVYTLSRMARHPIEPASA